MSRNWVPQQRLTGKTSSWGTGWGGFSFCAVPCFEALAAPLTVVDLTRLALTNRHFRDKPWPQLAILADDSCKIAVPQDQLAPLLEELGGRLRGPACIQAAAKAIGSADAPRLLAWAEEDARRATWVLTAVLSSRWQEIEDKPYFVRLLSSALASWRHVPVSTACCILAMVRKNSVKANSTSDWQMREQVFDAFRDAGVAHLLERLLKLGRAPAQRAAAEALQLACDLGGDPLSVAPAGVIPNLLLMAQSGCQEMMKEALNALAVLGEYPEHFPDDGIPVLVELLGHRCDDIQEGASSALWGFICNAEHLAKIACEHGCLKPLIAQLQNKRILAQYPLFCLEIALGVATQMAAAVELGLLPVLFHCLRDEKDLCHIEVILEMLQACCTHVPQALLEETATLRKTTIRKVVVTANRKCTEAMQLLRLLDHANPQMSMLIRQAGYREHQA